MRRSLTLPLCALIEFSLHHYTYLIALLLYTLYLAHTFSILCFVVCVRGVDIEQV